MFTLKCNQLICFPTAILPQFQKLDFIPDVKDTQLLLLAELCIRIHKSNFYEEQNGSNQSNSTPFSECIIDVFKDHGVSDEKLSQLVIFFKKVANIIILFTCFHYIVDIFLGNRISGLIALK